TVALLPTLTRVTPGSDVFGDQGGRNDLVRRHNLALVLRRVHVAPATRSELTRVSGLNRSTIGALVAELVDRGLVVEDDAAGVAVPGGVGRTEGLVRIARHLGWRDVRIAGMVGEAFGVHGGAGSDASLGAKAEWVFGAGRGVVDLVYVHGGASGVGGGIIS